MEETAMRGEGMGGEERKKGAPHRGGGGGPEPGEQEDGHIFSAAFQRCSMVIRETYVSSKAFGVFESK